MYTLTFMYLTSSLLVHDRMVTERPREDYYKEATSYFNSGERAAAESGESYVMLSSLTRGPWV